jgi:PKD repeat protein
VRSVRVLVLAIGALLCAPVVASATWLPGSQIDGTGGATHAVALGQAPDGANAVLAWVGADTAAGHTRLNVAVLVGGAWVAKGPIDIGTGDVSAPGAATVAAGGVVTWLQSDGAATSPHVRLWAALVSPQVVGAPHAVDAGTKDVLAAAPTIDTSGTVTVGYVQFVAGREQALAVRGIGGTWGAPVGLDAPPDGGVLPRIAVSGGGLGAAVAFVEGGADGVYHLYVKRWTGAMWAGAEKVDAGVVGQDAVDVALSMVAPDRGVVSWTQYLTGRRRVYAAVVTGGVWSAPSLLDPSTGAPGDIVPTGDASAPSVSADGTSGTAVVVWAQAVNSRSRVFSARMTGWNQWQASTPIDDPLGSDSSAPVVSIAAPAGDGVAAWYGWKVDADPALSAFHIYVAALAGGQWLAAQDVGLADGAPVIGVNSLGQRIAIWINGSTVVQSFEDTVPPTASLRACTLLAGHPYSFELTGTDPGAAVCDDPGPGVYAALATDDHGVARAAWDFGDGTTATTVPVSHTYHKGTYQLGLNVWDAVGNTGGATTTLAVVDRDGPVITAGPDVTAEVGQTLTFTVDPIDLESGVDLASVAWTFSDGGTATGLSITHTFATAGAVTVTVSAADLNTPVANVSTDAATVTVVAPVAPTPPGNLHAARSPTNQAPVLLWDGVSNAARYDVYQGAETVARTVSAPRTTYTESGALAEGTYTYHLVAVSARNLVSAATPAVAVVVDLTAPTSLMALQLAGQAGRPLRLDLRPSEPLASVAWDFGDATAAGSGAIVDHSFALAGSYHLKATFADLAGNASSLAVVVTIAAALTADAGPNVSARVGDSVPFHGTATSVAAITSYAWAFGDGGAATGASPHHVYARSGAFRVVLTVQDAAGHVATAATWAEIAVRGAPIVKASGPKTAFLGDRVPFHASARAGERGVTLKSLTWAFGDRKTAKGLKASHVYRSLRAFVVYFTAIDSKRRSARARIDTRIIRLTITIRKATWSKGRLTLVVDARSAGTLKVRVGTGRAARTYTVRLRRAGVRTATIRIARRVKKGTHLALVLHRSQGATAKVNGRTK